jgi:hypothetical protein
MPSRLAGEYLYINLFTGQSAPAPAQSGRSSPALRLRGGGGDPHCKLASRGWRPTAVYTGYLDPWSAVISMSRRRQCLHW